MITRNTTKICTAENKKTNVEGVYAAGDVCIKNLRQVVTAVSDGAIASTSLEKFVADKYSELGLEKKEPEIKKPAAAEAAAESTHAVDSHQAQQSPEDSTFITKAMKEQLKPIFDKFQRNIKLVALLDNRHVSSELKIFLEEAEGLSSKISITVLSNQEPEASKYADIVNYYPSLLIFNDKDEYMGVQFHGVPGGHEFNSFIVALYNAAGPGQAIDEHILNRIKNINKKISLKAFISLSCTMCPEVVMSSQRIALENKNVEAEMFDLSLFPEIKEKYKIMSVPCLLLNDEQVIFGKKNIDQLLSYIENK